MFARYKWQLSTARSKARDLTAEPGHGKHPPHAALGRTARAGARYCRLRRRPAGGACLSRPHSGALVPPHPAHHRLCQGRALAGDFDCADRGCVAGAAYSRRWPDGAAGVPRVSGFPGKPGGGGRGACGLACATALRAGAGRARRSRGDGPTWRLVFRASLAFLASLAVGSAVLHGIKIVLGRRRPRDELEHSLYGFLPWRFDFQYDSFPSGHAMTICCVAVILSAVLPAAAPLWVALAIYLGVTRALLNAHFLSDVFIGAGIGLLASRETVLLAFPDLARPWF